MKEEEIWKPIVGYEGFYEVSNTGKIRSVDRFTRGPSGKDERTRLVKGRIRRVYLNKSGYYQVGLQTDSRQSCKQHLVHRLVAQAFIPNPDNLPQINHKDENKQNNHVDNLEWCTSQYNVNYGTGLKRRSKNKSKSVVQIDKNTLQIINKFDSIRTAALAVGIGRSWAKISAVCLGKRKTAGGYRWAYEITPRRK